MGNVREHQAKWFARRMEASSARDRANADSQFGPDEVIRREIGIRTNWKLPRIHLRILRAMVSASVPARDFRDAAEAGAASAGSLIDARRPGGQTP